MYTPKNLFKLIGRNILISLIFISITLVSIFFIDKEIERMTNSIVLNHNLELELKKRLELFSTIEDNAKIISNNEKLINDAFPLSDDVSLFINSMDELALKHQITQTYKFDSPVSSTIGSPFPLSTIYYSNTIATDILNFSEYLKDFEKLPYFTKIEGLNILSQDSLGWLGISNITIRSSLLTKTTK